MKAFIIYINTQKSIEYAQRALDSFNKYVGWEPEMFEGITVTTLPVFERSCSLRVKERSRAKAFENESTQGQEKLIRFLTKKSCSMNHYRLFKLCRALNEPIAIIEHDAHCIADYNQVGFDDVLVLNVKSAASRHPDRHVRENFITPEAGISDLRIPHLVYRHDPDINGSYVMPGTAAYCITPQGAQKMINVYENIGWEQSDFIINTAYVRIQVINPELFTFKLPNLQMSHGVDR